MIKFSILLNVILSGRTDVNNIFILNEKYRGVYHMETIVEIALKMSEKNQAFQKYIMYDK